MVSPKKLFAILLACLALSNAFAAALYVPDQYPSIQAALNASFPSDVIWVRPGLYHESLNFGGKDVAVRSLEGPKNTILSPTLARGAVIGPGGELSGLTISNAYSAVEAFGSGSLIRSNLFIKNFQSNWGAGVGGNGASPRIEQNTFLLNVADSQSLSGVIVFANGSSPQIINNLFVSNYCAAISLVLPSGNSVQVLNNTFVANQKAILHRSFSPIMYRNNILFGNDVGLAWEYADPPIWQNNLVYGNNRDYEAAVTGPNNLSEPPNFYDVARGDYRLTRSSPAVDSGLDGPAVDLTGHPRPVDGNLDGNAVVDRGAFEYVPGPPHAPTISTVFSSPISVDLTWLREPETQIYIVSRGASPGGPYIEIGRTPALTFSDTTAERDQEYFYVVAGLNDLGTGPNSTAVRERGGNLPPTAVADTLSVNEDTVTLLNPLANDSDPNNDAIAISSVTGAGATLTDNRIQFTPVANFFGTNTLQYVVTDGRSAFATNQITVRVLPINDPPSGLLNFFSVDVGGIVDFPLAGYDIDSEDLRFELVREPEFGRIESFSSNGRLRYLAGRSASTFDSFSFRVFDGVDYSVPAEISIQRIPPRDLDLDGVPDAWETLHDLNNPAGDRDHDGAINADEYLAYTDPNDSESVLKLDAITAEADGSVRLKWRAIGSIRYRLQSATAATGPFTDIIRPFNDEVFPARDGEPGLVEFRVAPSGDSLRFFRIKVAP